MSRRKDNRRAENTSDTRRSLPRSSRDFSRVSPVPYGTPRWAEQAERLHQRFQRRQARFQAPASRNVNHRTSNTQFRFQNPFGVSFSGVSIGKERINHPPGFREAVCLKRRIRREVLHAFGRTGSGTGTKPPRYTELSKVRCKR